MEILFQIVNGTVLPFWLLMVIAPRWGLTRRIMGSLVVPALLAALYIVLVVPALPEFLPLLVHPDLAGLAELLGRPEATVVGWVHFLTFDLFVGRWEYLDAQERRLPHGLLAPALVLTLLLGPMGLLTYLVMRWLASRGRPDADAPRSGR
jgi:hypothetical protein